MITDKYEYTIAIINSLLLRIKYNEKDAIDTYIVPTILHR